MGAEAAGGKQLLRHEQSEAVADLGAGRGLEHSVGYGAGFEFEWAEVGRGEERRTVAFLCVLQSLRWMADFWWGEVGVSRGEGHHRGARDAERREGDGEMGGGGEGGKSGGQSGSSVSSESLRWMADFWWGDAGVSRGEGCGHHRGARDAERREGEGEMGGGGAEMREWQRNGPHHQSWC